MKSIALTLVVLFGLPFAVQAATEATQPTDAPIQQTEEIIEVDASQGGNTGTPEAK